MNIDIMRIKTLPNGERVGTLISSEYEGKEKLGQINDEDVESLIYRMDSKEVTLCDIESLEDGDYKIELFDRVYVAASFVSEGESLPTITGSDCYRFLEILED